MMKLAVFVVVFVFTTGFGVDVGYSATSEDTETIGVSTKTECFDVPYSVEKTRTKDSIFQDIYICPLEKDEDELVESFIEVATTCYETVEKEVFYKCPKETTKNVCFNMPIFIPKLCSKPVTKKVPVECEKQKSETHCQLVEKEFPGTCMDVKSYSKPYDCWTTEVTKTCEMKLDATCTREVKKIEPYEYEEMQTEKSCCVPQRLTEDDYSCTETIYEKKCENIGLCDKTTYQQEIYDCSVKETVTSQCNIESCVPTSTKLRKLFSKKSCRKGEKVSQQSETYPCNKEIIIPKSCTRTVPVKIKEACSDTVNDKQCIMVPVVKPIKCEKPAAQKQTIQCAEDCKIVSTPANKPVYKQVDKIESYPCVPEESCYEVKKPKKDICYATLLEAVERECLQKKFEQKCKSVKVMDKCYKDEVTNFSYPCPEHDTEEKCVSIPVYEMQKCAVTLPIAKEYPCTESQLKITSRKKAQPKIECLRDVTKSFSYKCYETKYRHECVTLEVSKIKLPAVLKTDKISEFERLSSSKQHSGVHSIGSSKQHSGVHSIGSSKQHSGVHSIGSSKQHSGVHSIGSSKQHSGVHSIGSSKQHSGVHSIGSSKQLSGVHSIGSSKQHSGAHSIGSSKQDSGVHSKGSFKQHSGGHSLVSFNTGTSSGDSKESFTQKPFTHSSGVSKSNRGAASKLSYPLVAKKKFGTHPRH